MPGTDRVSEAPRTDEGHGPAGLLHRIRANPSGRVALKVGIGTAGGLVLAIGVAMIPLPGPGWAIVILGLAILALEFAWARHALEFTKRHVQSWTHWVGRQSLPLRLLIGLVGLLFVAAVVWESVRLSFGVDLAALAWGWLGGS
ncbi:TIGR02611 family protein [Krasilnikovia sp. MM14-A1259]|uniref:TIGR02611 family protein n=1 Tax=Krasilnikovia sp. MM14-A1259 TaxID=3373539 RepID=UPI0038252825